MDSYFLNYPSTIELMNLYLNAFLRTDAHAASKYANQLLGIIGRPGFFTNLFKLSKAEVEFLRDICDHIFKVDRQ